MTNLSRSYKELLQLETFEERYEYLKLNGVVAEDTFGSKRYLNQMLYTSPEWRSIRDTIIVRDSGCDLGIIDRPIHDKIYIHHINPITIDDILDGNPIVFDPNNLICVSHITHEAIHYGDSNLLPKDYVERTPNDTCLWRR
ncbi:MAG: hypothetical protein MJZ20_01600 [Bacteroidaceae bacterium]|nr:hypothetical protein [Bacteroidaceae bacterium]